MANALTDVQNTFTTLDANFNLLYAACTTDKERTDLGLQYGRAMANYQKCVNKFLSDDDPTIAALSSKLQTANDKVAKAVTQMGNMSHVIDEITEAVDLGAAVVAFAFTGI